MELARGSRPDPAQASDIGEFVELLGALRVLAGSPSYRLLAKRVGPLLRPPRQLSYTTLADAFQPGRRRLDLDLVVAVVRALGLDEAEVGRWRDACVAVHVGAKAGGVAAALRQLPADLGTFTGRQAELRELAEAVEAVPGRAGTVVVSAIEGMAGVGKTQLAIRFAHGLVRTGRYDDVQLYANLRGFDPAQPPAEPAAVLDSFLRALGIPVGQIPVTLDERAAMFRDRIHGKRALILLDDAADEEQVRDLIPADPGCLVLITSRRTMAGLDGAGICRLDVFDHDEGVELLSRIVGAERVGAEPDAAAAVVEACGRLPLAVRIAAARIASRPGWSLREYARRLADTSSRLDRLAVGNLAVRASLALSFEHLSGVGARGAARAFRRLGLWTGPDITATAAAALFGVDPATAETTLEELVDVHLLQTQSSGRYHFHDLVKVFAAELAEELTDEERVAALTGILGWYVQVTAEVAVTIGKNRVQPAPGRLRLAAPLPVFAADDDAIAWCESERGNLLAAIRLAVSGGLADLAWPMPLNLFGFYNATRHVADWNEALGTVAAVLAALEQLAKPARFNGIPSADPAGKRGLVLALGGDPVRAIPHFRRAAEAFEGLDSTMGTANQYSNIGDANIGLGLLDEAATWLESAIALSREHAHRFHEAKALAALAGVEQRRGNMTAAAVLARQALEAARETGNRLDEARALDTLGQVLEYGGKHEDAVSAWTGSLAILAELGEQYYEAS